MSEEPHRPPLVPPGYVSRYREVTVSAVLFAIIIGVIMNAAITYAGLKIGFTIGGSAIAAVLGFGVLRGLLRRGTILETNVAQTVASAINTSNSGVIFTVPVLFLIGYELSINGADFWLITLACICGAYLGTAFIIPLRKQMLDIERLRFPSPTGVATILKSPGAGPAKAVVLVLGMLLGAAIFLPAGLPALQVEADLDQLDELVRLEKITVADAERTRAIEGWIVAETAPQRVVERGEIVGTMRLERDGLERVAARLSRAVSAGRAESDIESMTAELLERRRGVTALQEELASYGEAAEDTAFGDDLAYAAHLANAGEAAWSSLRSRSLGWAARPLFGYSDLDIRLPEEQGEDGALTTRVDRDGSGRPDLVVTDSTVDVGRWFNLPDDLQLIFAIAPFALGAGFITGRAGLFVLAGGILAFFVINPVAFRLGWMPEMTEAHQAANYGFAAFNRPLGIGLLLGGALMGVLASAPAIREAVKSIAFAGRTRGGADELGLTPILLIVILALAALFAVTDHMGRKPINTMCPVTQLQIDSTIEPIEIDGYTLAFASEDAKVTWSTSWTVEQQQELLDGMSAKPGLLAGFSPTMRALLIALVGTFWIWFAGIIIAQCAGMTDWSPISGMALLTVVLILLLAGTGAVLMAVLVGAALCVAITLGADMMGDLKTGYLVGALPRRQQRTELMVVWIGPIVCMLTLWVIVQANLRQGDIPIGPGTATVAPQAQALQAVVTGVQGGEMPYALYGMGAGLGALLGLGAFSGLGVLIGLSMYLPFQYIATYGIGCLLNIGIAWVAGLVFGRRRGRTWTEEWGVPFAAGLIVGESILALLINIVVLREADPMAMRLLSSLLITVSLVLGLVSTLTAYVPRLDAVELALERDPESPLHLNATAGHASISTLDDSGDESAEPVVVDTVEMPVGQVGDALDADLIAVLRAADVDRVRVREFGLGRWSGRWLFLLAVVGLVGGALLGRMGRKQQLAMAQGSGEETTSPRQALEEAETLLEQLRADLPEMPGDTMRLEETLDRLGDIQRNQFMTFVEAKDRLIASFGMANYAQLMDRFAALERKVNRAWSAAADGEVEEMMWCLDVSSERIAQTIEKLPIETDAEEPPGDPSVWNIPEEEPPDEPSVFGDDASNGQPSDRT